MAAIPASAIVNVLPNVIGAGGSGLDLVGLILTNSTRPPIGSVLRFASAADVSSYFGPVSQEATLAGIYFAGYTGSSVTPASLLFTQYPAAAVPAYVRGGNISGLTLAQLNALSGTINATIDGRTINTSTINLNTATSFSNAASIIQTGLNDKDASFTGVIAVTTGILTASAVTGTIAAGQVVTGGTTPAGTIITSQLSGTTGGAGTYQTNIITAVASTSMVSGATTVVYDSVSGGFVITAGTPGLTSNVVINSGSLSPLIAITAATGAVSSPGAIAGAPASAMDAVVASTQDFATFMTTFEPNITDALAFANWNNGKNNRYVYVCWDTDTIPTTNADTTSLGYLIKTLAYSGTELIYSPTNLSNAAAFEMGQIASINFNAVNGRVTSAFRSGTNLVPDVTNQTIGANLIANGYNFYGAYATANAQFTFFYPGQISGKFAWVDSYIDQVWMNNGFQLALMGALTTLGTIPYNASGYAQIEAVMLGQINLALSFGAIRSGVTLSALQAQAVNAAAGGRNIAETIVQRGWYVLVQDATPAVRAARGTPPVSFFYTDGQSIQQITLSSVLVQ